MYFSACLSGTWDTEEIFMQYAALTLYTPFKFRCSRSIVSTLHPISRLSVKRYSRELIRNTSCSSYTWSKFLWHSNEISVVSASYAMATMESESTPCLRHIRKIKNVSKFCINNHIPFNHPTPNFQTAYLENLHMACRMSFSQALLPKICL
jgi:hypothetical protein